ncbi:hypothetical protein EVAR_37184_1 [Eumeta japonica]|uniref:Uncharacterized protein n=1 Tax=Eumeta variegata TaxID=151549 RepID=A0A4C1WHV9_EUMVA|nr:hypothetical protein EVAR_37184_1 [Eumeta japonica]
MYLRATLCRYEFTQQSDKGAKVTDLRRTLLEWCSRERAYSKYDTRLTWVVGLFGYTSIVALKEFWHTTVCLVLALRVGTQSYAHDRNTIPLAICTGGSDFKHQEEDCIF